MDIDLSGDLSKLKVVDLKAALTARGLDTKGIKAVLVSRLEAAILEEGKNSAGMLIHEFDEKYHVCLVKLLAIVEIMHKSKD